MTPRLPSLPKGRPFVLGHRGARAHAPDNTLRAFELAIEHGADGIEVDVRMTADGALCIAHDEEIHFEEFPRLLRLGRLTKSQLGKLHLPGGHRVPTLRGVLEFQARTGCMVNVELKGEVENGAWMCEQAAREIRVHGGNGLVLSSFSPLTVKRLTKLLPEIPTALLFDKDQTLMQRVLPLSPLGAVGAHPEDACVTPEMVTRLKRKGAFVGVWTVNDSARAKALAEMGVDVLISDDPGPIVRSFR